MKTTTQITEQVTTVEQADTLIESIGMTDMVEDYEENELGHVYQLTDNSRIVVTSPTSFEVFAAEELTEVEKQPEYEQFYIGQQVEVIAGYYAGNKGTVINLQPQKDGSAIVQVQWRNNQTKYIPSIALADNTVV